MVGSGGSVTWGPTECMTAQAESCKQLTLNESWGEAQYCDYSCDGNVVVRGAQVQHFV